IRKAIEILDIIFGNPEVDPSQAVAHTLLGEIYESQGQYKKAYEEYRFAERYYIKLYKNKISDIYEISKLYANLAMLGIKIHDNVLIRQYLGKLINDFSFKNPNTKRVIETLEKQQSDLLD